MRYTISAILCEYFQWYGMDGRELTGITYIPALASKSIEASWLLAGSMESRIKRERLSLTQ